MRIRLGCLLLTALCSLSCSIPNLESSECSEARDAAKRFYSFHLANEMRPSVENFKMREQYLTPRYYASIATMTGGDRDPFTQTSDYPKTFKVGTCRMISPTNADLQIQLYWRDDKSTAQREVAAFMLKQGDTWLLDSVDPPGH